MSWDKEAAEVSRAAAEQELRPVIEKMTPEQKEALREVARWMKRWYDTARHDGAMLHAAGWKALAKTFCDIML